MPLKKKIIVGLVLILSITVSTTWAQTRDVEKGERGGRERIVHFVHTGAINGYIEPPDGFGGWAAIAGFVDSLRKKGETVFLLDAGDGQWGSGAALVTGGEIPAQLANAANYDAILLGNLDVYSSSLESLNMPLIEGNSDFYKAYGTIPSAVPFAIIKKSGISVGVIGALYGAPNKKKPYKEHRKMIKKMKKEKVDVVVLLAHDARGRDWNEYKRMGVDIVLAHWSQFRRLDKDKLVKSTGMAFSYTTGVRKGRNLSHLKLRIKRGKSPVVLLEEEVLLNENKIRVNRKVDNIAEKERLRVNRILDETIGEAAEDFSHSLSRRSPVGKLVLNAVKESTDAEIVIYNSPGIRTGLKKGIIKYSHLVDILPFGSRIVTLELKGKDLQELARLYNRNVLASGIEFGRVVRVNNRLLNPERYYLVASNDYLLQHGSGPFKVLKKGSNKIYYGYDIEVLRDYVRENFPTEIETAPKIYAKAKEYQEIGETYFEKKEKEKAIAIQAVSRPQETPIPKKTLEDYKMLAEIYKEQEKYQKAIDIYQRALEIAPQNIALREKLARLYRKEEMYDEAVGEYKRLLELKPEKQGYRLDLAGIYKYQKKFEEAIAECKKVLEIAKGRWLINRAQGELAEVYRKAGMLSKMIEEYEKRIKKEPKDINSYRFLIKLYEKQWNYAKIVSACKKALEIAPNDEKIHSALAQAYRSQRRYKEASLEYRKLAELKPDQTWYHRRLADCYFKIEEKKKACRILEELIVQNPDKSSVYSGVGSVYKNNRMYEEAIAAFKKAIELSPGREYYTREQLADIYKEQGRYEEAIGLYKEALTLTTHKGTKNRLSFRIADTYERAERYDEAIRGYKEIIEKGASGWTLTQAQRALIDIYERQGRLDELAREYEEKLKVEIEKK